MRRDFNTLSFYLKGDPAKDFTRRVKVELKDQSGRPSPYVVANLTGDWQKVSVPFEKFRRVSDWSRMNEFVVVFDDMNSRPKTGSLLIDQVTFSKE